MVKTKAAEKKIRPLCFFALLFFFGFLSLDRSVSDKGVNLIFLKEVPEALAEAAILVLIKLVPTI